MKIVQISSVTEHYMKGSEFVPYEDATVYGLGDDGKVYYYGEVEKTAKKGGFFSFLNAHDEDITTEKQFGWKPYGTA
jgi:hypothetical protein